MTGGANVYSIAAGSTPLASLGIIPIIEQRDPTVSDVTGPAGSFHVGQQWINSLSNIPFQLTSLSSTAAGTMATWQPLASLAFPAVYDTQSGTASASGGVINITGTEGVTTSGSGNTITVTGPDLSNLFPITPYVVGPTGLAGYQTIQSAIDAAHTSATTKGVVYVMPQSSPYTENLTLYDGVDIVGTSGAAANFEVVIIGQHTPPTSGTMALKNLALQNSGQGLGSIIYSASAGSALLIIEDCSTYVFSGFTFQLPFWTGPLAIINCIDNGSNTNGVVSNASGANVFLLNSMVSGSAGSMSITGLLEVQGTFVNCSLTMSSNGILIATNSSFQDVTFTNSAQGAAYNCSFVSISGNVPAITMQSSGDVEIVNSLISSPNNPAIAGTSTGALILGTCTFDNNTNISPGVTLSWATTETGSVFLEGSQNGYVNTSISSSTSPYSVAANDFYLAVNTSTGPVTVNLLSTPVEGNHLVIADATGSGGTNNVTINGNGNNIVYQGTSASSAVINSNYGAIDMTFDGSVWLASAGQASSPPTPPASFTWNSISTNQTLVASNGYFVVSGTLSLALPASSSIGDTISVSLVDTGTSWTITQAAGQKIRLGNTSSTIGTGGSVSSTQPGDTITIVSYSSGLWEATSSVGTFTFI
jgi:hypothetical protein